jgi:hypothetical protein
VAAKFKTSHIESHITKRGGGMFSKAKRFQNESPDTPGVGAYDINKFLLQDRSYLFSKSDRFDPCDRAKGTPLPFTSQTEYMDCLRQRNNLADKTAKNSVKQPRKMTGGVDVQDEW